MISDRLLQVGFLGLAAAFGGVAHRFQVAVDEVRPEPGSLEDRVFLPEPASMKVAVMGFDGVAADLMWVRTVLSFAEIYEHPEPAAKQWLGVMLRTVSELDPPWRTVYFYGGSMLRTIDDIDGSDELFSRGMSAIPSDPYFPFSIAMNAYLYRDDVDRAVTFMHAAASLPDAPDWYRLASAGFLDRRGQRKAALRYLEEQIRDERDEHLREQLQARYAEVLHDELASQLEAARSRYVQATGRSLARPEDLGTLSPDPLGGRWMFGIDGAVRSDVREAAIREKDMRRDRNSLLQLWKR